MTTTTRIRPATLAMIEQLVSFDTTSRESNLGLIEWVRDWLGAQGVDSRLVYDADRRKANLFATIHGRNGPGSNKPGIVLSGHTDVVPVDGQAWDSFTWTALLMGQEDRGAVLGLWEGLVRALGAGRVQGAWRPQQVQAQV